MAYTGPAPSAIYQWDYIIPSSQTGKFQTTIPVPDGAGIVAVPIVNLAGRDLTRAYLIGAEMSGADARGANLTNADMSKAYLANANLSDANLTDAVLDAASLAGANFSGATVRRASIRREFVTNVSCGLFGCTSTTIGYGGISPAQLATTLDYQARDLTGMDLEGNNFTGANLVDQNLTNVDLHGATLTDANFTGATILGASFGRYTITSGCERKPTIDSCRTTTSSFGTGISFAQLSSTASYLARDLSGIDLGGNNLTGGNFSQQNLTGASFLGANLASADFSSANLTQVNLRSATLTSANLSGVDAPGADFSDANLSSAVLSGANLSQAILARTSFSSASLTGANLASAVVRGANFTRSVEGVGGISLAQLYSTATYLERDLSGINFTRNDLTGADFAGHTLTTATFSSATLAGADLSAADARGAADLDLTGAATTNLIRPNGQIEGLNLGGPGRLVVRDYGGFSVLPITVNEHVSMNGGTLRIELDEFFQSKIGFTPGIPVTLDGTLELAFGAGINVLNQVGQTFDLFDWTGVTPSGEFVIVSPHTWDLANLYTTGEVTLTAVYELPGDFNGDGAVDAADYVVWRKNSSGQANYDAWRASFGRALAGSGSAVLSAERTAPAVPEPSAVALAAAAALTLAAFHRRRLSSLCLGWMLLAAAPAQVARADTIELTDLPGVVVSANSFAPGGEPELTIDNRDWEDGQPYQWTAGDHGYSNNPNWVQLDFGSDYYLTRVELLGVFNQDLPFYWGYDNIYNLLAQPDGGSWVAIGSGRLVDSRDAAERDATFNYLPGAQPLARYLRYEVVGGSHWSFLGEFQVQGASVSVPEPTTLVVIVTCSCAIVFFRRAKSSSSTLGRRSRVRPRS
jgi:uncharacterized protein YjbI with pentapeptide repeats